MTPTPRVDPHDYYVRVIEGYTQTPYAEWIRELGYLHQWLSVLLYRYAIAVDGERFNLTRLAEYAAMAKQPPAALLARVEFPPPSSGALPFGALAPDAILSPEHSHDEAPDTTE